MTAKTFKRVFQAAVLSAAMAAGSLCSVSAVTNTNDAYSAILTVYANDIVRSEKFHILEDRGKNVYIGDVTGDGTDDLAFIVPSEDTPSTERIKIYSCDSGKVKLVYDAVFGEGIDHRDYKALFLTENNELYLADYFEGVNSCESYYQLTQDGEGLYDVSSKGFGKNDDPSLASVIYSGDYTDESYEAMANELINSAKTVILCNFAEDSSAQERSKALLTKAEALNYAEAQELLGGDTQLPFIGSDSEYVLPNSDRRYLDESDLVRLSNVELRYARNEIFARYNCMFEDESLSEYFRQFDWYDGYGRCTAKELQETKLNEYEKYNLELILAVESGR